MTTTANFEAIVTGHDLKQLAPTLTGRAIVRHDRLGIAATAAKYREQ